MNLVKAQEYAASLPLAELKKYADGLNPGLIPPWLATGEMEAKTKRMEMASNLQGASQGQQPSIKEQVEKKAGLMALQQAQKAQMQAMQPTPMGGPVPEGTPEPEQQPEPQPGLDQLQSNIQMAGGGIVAFATGNEVKAGPEFIRFLKQMGLDYIDYSKSAPEVQANIKEMFKAVGTAAEAAPTASAAAPVAAEAAKDASLLRRASEGLGRFGGAALRKAGPAGLGIDAISHMGDYKIQDKDNIDTSAAGTLRDLAKGEFGRAGTGLKRGLGEAAMDLGSFGANMLDYVVPGKAPVSSAYDRFLKENVEGLKGPEGAAPERGRPTMVNDPRLNPDLDTSARGPGAPVATPSVARPPAAANPNAPRPNTPAVSAANATPAPNSMDAMFRQSLETKPKERKIEDLIAEQNAIRAGTGLDEPAGKAKLERIGGIDKLFKDSQMTPMQEFISMLGKAGQYKGLSGFAPAYIGIEEAKNAAKLKHAKDINELMGGVEDTQRAEKTGVAGKVQSAREKDVENAALFDRDKMKALEGARGQDAQERISKYTADSHLKGVMAQVNLRGDARANLTPAQRGQIVDKAVDNVANQIKQDMRLSMQVAKNPALREQMIQRETERLFSAATGITMDAAPSAASPSGNTRMRFDINGNPIK